MKKYFYDREDKVLITVNDESGDMAIILPASFEATDDKTPDTAFSERQGKAPRQHDQKIKGAGCSECGSPTVHRKGCSKRVPIKGGRKSQGKGRHSIVCKNCGGEGHQARTCKLTPTPTKEGERDIDKVVKLTEAQFDDAKEQHNDGSSSGLIGLTMPDVDLDEIRRAIKCASFEEYATAS
jgi:hypothetical protein